MPINVMAVKLGTDCLNYLLICGYQYCGTLNFTALALFCLALKNMMLKHILVLYYTKLFPNPNLSNINFIFQNSKTSNSYRFYLNPLSLSFLSPVSNFILLTTGDLFEHQSSFSSSLTLKSSYSSMIYILDTSKSAIKISHFNCRAPRPIPPT